MSIKLITFDLDDTLWDTAPVIVSAEAYCANGWRTRTESGRGAGGAPVAIRERMLQPNPASSTASAPCAGGCCSMRWKKPATPSGSVAWPTRL
jgi:hypothetical protein